MRPLCEMTTPFFALKSIANLPNHRSEKRCRLSAEQLAIIFITNN